MYIPDLKDLTNDELQDRQTVLLSRLHMLASNGKGHAMAMAQCNIWVDEVREEMFNRVASYEEEENSGIVYDSSEIIEPKKKPKEK